MARTFNGINQFFGGGLSQTPPIPYTFACWVRSLANGSEQQILGIRDAANTQISMIFKSATNLASQEDRNGITELVQTIAIPIGSWHHVAAVYEAGVGRTIYLDGANAVSGPATVQGGLAIAGMGDNGAAPGTAPFNGQIAHFAVWIAPLTAGHIQTLAMGASPLRVVREGLGAYFPVQRTSGDERDVMTGSSLLPENNGPIPYGGEPAPSFTTMWGSIFVAPG